MRELSTVAECAKLIRKDLKAHFPNIKFTVRSENYSGGDSIHVGYQNGVPEKEVEAIINKYQYGSFNGMIDIYEYTNYIEGLPQTKYLFVNREVTEDNKQKIREKIMKDFGLPDFSDETCMKTFNYWADQVLEREMKDLTF